MKSNFQAATYKCQCGSFCVRPAGESPKPCDVCDGELIEVVPEEKDLSEILKDLIDQSKYQSCMCLSVDEDAKSVELIMDTSIDTRAEWIPGEGGDVCLYRSQEDEHVVGVRLPLKRTNLAVHHAGPLRVNAGFRTEDVM